MPTRIYISTENENDFSEGLMAAAEAAEIDERTFFVYRGMKFWSDVNGYYTLEDGFPLTDPEPDGAVVTRVTIMDEFDDDGPAVGLYGTDNADGQVCSALVVLRNDTGQAVDQWTRYSVLVTATERQPALDLFLGICTLKIPPLEAFQFSNRRVERKH